MVSVISQVRAMALATGLILEQALVLLGGLGMDWVPIKALVKQLVLA